MKVKTCRCGKDLSNVKPQRYIKRQRFEIPKIRINVTEYNAEIKLCPCCGHKNIAEFPENITQNVQYGKNLKTFAIYTKNQIFTSYDKLKTKFLDIAGQSLSPATLIGFEKQAYSGLEKFEEEVKTELIRSPVLNADETSLKVISERWWLHSIGNDHLTCYMVHPRRGSIATDEMGVLPQYDGILVHDFWPAYAKYNCSHSYCNAHLMRELQGIIDGYGQKWAEEMKLLYGRVYCYLFVEEKNNPQEIKTFREEYIEIIGRGLKENPPPDMNKRKGTRGRIKRSKALNLLLRLKNYSDDILRFMYNSLVPFTNNLAERDVRMMKVQQKISGTFRTTDGARRFCRIRSYISTVRKNGKSVFEALKRLVRGKPYTLQELMA